MRLVRSAFPTGGFSNTKDAIAQKSKIHESAAFFKEVSAG